MKKYVCNIWSNSNNARSYDVTTSSAKKCAEEFGRCENGEVVSVCTAGGREVSRASWTCEDGGKYIRCCIW